MNPDEDITLLEDPVWTERYEREESRVREAAGEDLLGIHHVGSTAIPDVPGKPALDVLVAFDSLDGMAETADRIVDSSEEFQLQAESDVNRLVIDWADDHAVFLRMHTMDEADKIRNQILFREYVCDHPDARREYSAVKREAVAEHADDHAEYTQHKTDVVSDILERAHEAGYEERLPDYLR